MTPVLFSIILPLYRQGSRIARLIEDYVTGLSSLSDPWELILVVNGPDDGAFEQASRLAAAQPNMFVHRLADRGWGRAVRHGIAAARGQYVCYTNSGRTQVPDLLLMLRYAKVNEQVVVKATRIVRESFIRKLGSVIYNFENRFLFRTAIMDVNGTPKVFPRTVWDRLQVKSNDDLIDAEAIARCFQLQIPVVEVPVRLTARRSGKSTTGLLSAFRMYVGLLRLRRTL